MRFSGLFALACCVAGAFGVEVSDCGSKGKAYSIGDEATVCITLNGRKRAVFNPVVDNFTLLHLEDSYDSLPVGVGVIQEKKGWAKNLSFVDWTSTSSSTSAYVGVTVASGGAESLPHLYKEISLTATSSGKLRVTKAYSFPVYTAIIWMEEGVPKTVVWDEGCFFCDDGTTAPCLQSELDYDTNKTTSTSAFRACAIESQDCSGEDCDLKIFVAWTGSDAQGNYAESANLRFSRFRSFGVAGLFTTGQDAVAGASSGAKKAGNADSIPGSGIVPGS